jgi:Uma2 family endonuclease
MNESLSGVIEGLLHSPLLPEVVQALQERMRDESQRRQIFYQQMRDDEKTEFIDGQIITHSPARGKHLTVRKHLEKLLDTYVSVRNLGVVFGEKCLCVFPRNDYEPDVVFFGRDKAARITPDTLTFPVPDFVAEILSDSTEDRDRGVKFQDYEAHGVAEYWIIDPDSKVVEQYLLRGERFELALKSNSGEISSPTVPGFCIEIRALFYPADNLAALRQLI